MDEVAYGVLPAYSRQTSLSFDLVKALWTYRQKERMQCFAVLSSIFYLPRQSCRLVEGDDATGNVCNLCRPANQIIKSSRNMF